MVAVIDRLDTIEDRRPLRIDGAKPAVVEIHTAIRRNEAHVVRRKAGECFVQRLVGADKGFVEFQGLAAPLGDLVDVFSERVAVLHRQVLVDAAGDAKPRVDTPTAAGRCDDLLAKLADEDRPLADFREGFDYTDDVASRDRRLESEQEVGRSQMKEIQRVRLQHLTVMHQPPELFRRGCQQVHAGYHVHRLAGTEMMAHRTDTTQTLDDDWNFPVQPPLDESLEPAKLDNVEPSLFDLAGLIQPNGDLAVTFDARDRVDDDLAWPSADLRCAGLDVAHGWCPGMLCVIRISVVGRAAPAPCR